MDRREFCFTGAVVAAGIAVTGVQAASLLTVDAVIFDSRFAVARDFGAAARRKGQTIHAIEGDVTALWRDVLQRRWGGGAAATAGLTCEHSFFCLQELAKDHWRRVVVRRSVQLDERLVSWIIGGAHV